MKRILVTCLTTVITCLNGCSRVTDASKSKLSADSAVLAELESLPVGLEVIHSPTRVRSPVGPDSKGWPYRWNFRTEVRAIDRPLTIVKFGIIAWDGTRWVLPLNNCRYNAGIGDQTKFKEWYTCPSARIEPGKPAIDPENWAGSSTRTSFRQKWFFIADDDHGKRYKGEAVVELLEGD
jgi:hypothetical protein